MKLSTRYTHPFYMYEEIMIQPEKIASLIQNHEFWSSLNRIADELKEKDRVFLTGCGTSYYAALGGEVIARRLFGIQNKVRAVSAGELLHSWKLTQNDVIVALTHSGETYTVLTVLEEAKKKGLTTIALTGFATSQASKMADITLSTHYPYEKSLAHTISYTLAITSLLALFGKFLEKYDSSNVGESILDLVSKLPDTIQKALDIDDDIACVAHETCYAKNVVVLGTNMSVPTAYETSLKIAETSYIPVIALELEQMLHGYLVMCDSNSLVIVISPFGPAQTRVEDLARAIHRIQARSILITPRYIRGPWTFTIQLPERDDLLAPIVDIIAGQLFAYHITLAKGLNPDLIRRDQAAYLEARKCYA